MEKGVFTFIIISNVTHICIQIIAFADCVIFKQNFQTSGKVRATNWGITYNKYRTLHAHAWTNNSYMINGLPFHVLIILSGFHQVKV